MITTSPKPGLVKDRMPRIVAVAVGLDSSHNRSNAAIPTLPGSCIGFPSRLRWLRLINSPCSAVPWWTLSSGAAPMRSKVQSQCSSRHFRLATHPPVPLPPDMSSNQDEGHRQEVRVRPHVHSTLCPCVPHRLPCHVCWAGLLQPQHATRLGSVDRFCCSGRRNVWPIPYWSCVHHQYVRHWQLRESVWLHVLTIVVLTVSGCTLGLCFSFSALEPSCLLATVYSVLQCDTLAPR